MAAQRRTTSSGTPRPRPQLPQDAGCGALTIGGVLRASLASPREGREAEESLRDGGDGEVGEASDADGVPLALYAVRRLLAADARGLASDHVLRSAVRRQWQHDAAVAARDGRPGCPGGAPHAGAGKSQYEPESPRSPEPCTTTWASCRRASRSAPKVPSIGYGRQKQWLLTVVFRIARSAGGWFRGIRATRPRGSRASPEAHTGDDGARRRLRRSARRNRRRTVRCQHRSTAPRWPCVGGCAARRLPSAS